VAVIRSSGASASSSSSASGVAGVDGTCGLGSRGLEETAEDDGRSAITLWTAALLSRRVTLGLATTLRRRTEGGGAAVTAGDLSTLREETGPRLGRPLAIEVRLLAVPGGPPTWLIDGRDAEDGNWPRDGEGATRERAGVAAGGLAEVEAFCGEGERRLSSAELRPLAADLAVAEGRAAATFLDEDAAVEDLEVAVELSRPGVGAAAPEGRGLARAGVGGCTLNGI
jgi:hypothetical protein